MAVGYVRAARPEEAEELARIQLTTWRTAYRRLLPASALGRLDESWLATRWREAIETPPTPRHRVLVALEQAETTHLVGFLAAGPADSQAAAPEGPPLDAATTAAVTELLVEPRWGRRGHGSRLLAAAVDHWRDDRFTTAVAWAYEADRATVSFLTSAGWGPDGAHRVLDVDDRLVPQLRLRTVLSD